MNITGLTIEPHGSGYAVTVRLNILSDGMPSLEDITGMFVGLEAYDAEGSREPNDETEEAEDPTPAPSAKRGSRGRRKSTAAPEETTSADDGEDTPKAASTGRRGRKTTKPEPEQAPSSKGRRGRGKSQETPASEASSTDDEPVTNEDLTRAAGAAARAVGPVAVMEIVEEFGAERIEDVPDESRQELLDRLMETAK